MKTNEQTTVSKLGSRPVTHSLTTTGGALTMLLAATLALTGCSSVKTTENNAPVRARTFSFLNMGPRPEVKYAESRQQAHVAIQEAIIKNLAAKGVTHVTAGGNITVAYIVIVGNNVSTTSLTGYFGYGSDAEALLEKVHKEQTQAQAERGYFEAGTLVIDLLDPATSKVLQRRSISAPVLRDLPMESRVARVQSVVDQALADLRITN
jgi:hypothetical protein